MDEQQLQLKMVHVYVYKSKKYMDTQKIKTNIDAGHKQEKKTANSSLLQTFQTLVSLFMNIMHGYVIRGFYYDCHTARLLIQNASTLINATRFA